MHDRPVEPRMWRTLSATLAVALLGFVAFASLTQGFRVLTAESARREAVERSPVPVPELIAADQLGRVHDLWADPGLVGRAPRVTLVDFIYTRCESVCSSLNTAFQQVQDEIRVGHLEERVRLLSVSFDPAHDTPATMAAHARRLRADPRVWLMMTPTRPDQLPRLLTAFGIVVVPVPPDQFQHNAAFHLVDAQGRLVQIVDFGDPRAALDRALALGRHQVPGA